MGKVALVERLTDGTACQGDDCAVIDGTGNRLTLINTQTLVEGVNFDMTYTPLKHLGYKAVAVAISNIAAMNGTPHQVLVSVAVSNRYSVEALDELYACAANVTMPIWSVAKLAHRVPAWCLR